MVVFFVLLFCFVPTNGDLSILLLHNNDMHARFHQTDRYLGTCTEDSSKKCYGGFARTHSEVVRLKHESGAKGRPAIFLNAGDTYQGTPYYTFFKWPIVSKFMNMLDVDVMSLGNHEFDDGVAGVANYIANVTVPVVCCNLNSSLEPTLNQPNLTPSKIITVNGTNIGIIGYLTPDTKFLANTGKLQFLEEIISIRSEAKRLTDQNVTILIALGHSGYTKDQEIAREVEDIDVVVGGHSHTFLYTGTPPDVELPRGPYPTIIYQASGKLVPVVQAYYATKYLGYLELDFDSEGNLRKFNGSPILLSGNRPQDPYLLKGLSQYDLEISGKMNSILGYTNVLLDSRNAVCRYGECNLGNLITDSYVNYVSRHYNTSRGWTVAAVGIVQAGAIRASINSPTNANHNGSITYGDVITVIPFGSRLVILNMTGSVLLQALEFAVAQYEETGRKHVSEFLQVSGILVVYNMNQTEGHRVVSVSVRCADCDVPHYQPLQLDRKYAIIMSEYLECGGDGFYMFRNTTDRIMLDHVDYDVMADYIQQMKFIKPGVEDRITIIKTDSRSSTSSFNTLDLYIIALCIISTTNVL